MPTPTADGGLAILDGAHGRTVDDVARALKVEPTRGLADDSVADRRTRYGTNELEEQPTPSLLDAVRHAVTEPFVILLFVAGALAVLLGEARDGLLVLVGLVPIIGADVATSYRAERALASLRAAAAPRARVRRAGQVTDVLAADLVPGDVVLVRAGEIVPADVRITSADGLLVDRSALTGESVPELASVQPDGADSALPDRRAIAYAGTAVVGGRGEGLVVATGQATELGRIARDLADTERRRSPLQRELDRLVRILVVVAAALVTITMSLGFLRGETLGATVLAGISAAIAAIPEEPPVLLAVVLGLGAYRLLRRGVLVRRLSAEETLGAVDLIITDKTGTLTENRVVLREVIRPDGIVEDANEQGRLIELATRAEEDAWHFASGSPPGSFTRALMVAAVEVGHGFQLDRADLRDSAGPADGRPYSRTRAIRGGREESLLIGAPEAVLGLPLVGGVDTHAWRAVVEDEAARGIRLLMLADGDGDGAWRPIAMLGFADEVRSGVSEALRVASEAGIQTVVVTGDHPATAAAIAAAAGIETGRVIVGSELADWPDVRLADVLPSLTVVARASPEDKLRLVDVARRAGRTVAVTGDGVNDAPALQHADVAVSMGSGTAVARDASDLVLGDDSFATLLYGLREGRRIVANVQKGLVFLLSTHVALLGFILIATLAGFTQPLLPLQILWLELFIDLSTSISFEREREEPGSMRRPPRPRDRPLLTNSLLLKICVAGGFSAVAALVLMLGHDGSADHVRWLAFTSLVVAQVVRAYANRSLTRPISRLPPNVVLGLTVIVVIAIQAAIPSVPALAEAFRATPLDAGDWAIVACIALAPAIVAEIGRALTGREWVA